MFFTKQLKLLVLALPVLVVAFGVISGGGQLAAALGDAEGARWLRYAAVAVLLLLVVNAILLLAVLGLRAVEQDEPPRDE